MYLQDLIETVAAVLAKPRKSSTPYGPMIDGPSDVFQLEGHRFEVIEHEVSDPYSMSTYRRISVCTDNSRLNLLNVIYQVDHMDRDATSRERITACTNLAGKLVKELLPQLDAKIAAILSNMEIERALAVLD